MTPDQVQVVAAAPDLNTAYPLATRGGVERLGYMLAAMEHWRPLTTRCRTALSTAYHRALSGAAEGAVLSLPALPEGTHPRTVAALQRRGLAAGNTLTALGVEVVQLAEPITRARKPVITSHFTGDRL